MDSFDTAILNLLRDGKPRQFQEILTKVRFSHNTLRQHLDSLIDQRLILREKNPSLKRGRPLFTYSVPVGGDGARSVIPSPIIGVVSLSFEKLSQICRHEKGGFCKKARGQCDARICPHLR
jgi:predicted ArsR family transcriptional regulator